MEREEVREGERKIEKGREGESERERERGVRERERERDVQGQQVDPAQGGPAHGLPDRLHHGGRPVRRQRSRLTRSQCFESLLGVWFGVSLGVRVRLGGQFGLCEQEPGPS